LNEDESNWTIIAEGFHSIVDVERVDELDRRFPGQIQTLLRGRLDFDIDEFFESVELIG
jgi:hypothetical protein